jgi:hypothetical protein
VSTAEAEVAAGDYVSIGSPERVHVVMIDRGEFDQIRLPCVDHRARAYGYEVLTKAIAQNGVTVVFQYWLAPPAPHQVARTGSEA